MSVKHIQNLIMTSCYYVELYICTDLLHLAVSSMGYPLHELLMLPSAVRAAPSSSGPDGCWRSSTAPAALSAPPGAAPQPGRRPRGEAAFLPPPPRCSFPAAAVAPAPSARGQQRARGRQSEEVFISGATFWRLPKSGIECIHVYIYI